jgi:hypothetical protein
MYKHSKKCQLMETNETAHSKGLRHCLSLIASSTLFRYRSFKVSDFASARSFELKALAMFSMRKEISSLEKVIHHMSKVYASDILELASRRGFNCSYVLASSTCSRSSIISIRKALSLSKSFSRRGHPLRSN